MLPFARCTSVEVERRVACSCYSHYSVSSTSGKESALPREKGKSCPALHLERYMYRAHRSRLALFVDPPQLSSHSNSLSRIKAHQWYRSRTQPFRGALAQQACLQKMLQ